MGSPKTAGNVQVNPPRAREKSHSSHQQHPGGFWVLSGVCGELEEQQWVRSTPGKVLMGQGHLDPRAPSEPLQPRLVLKETVPAY